VASQSPNAQEEVVGIEAEVLAAVADGATAAAAADADAAAAMAFEGGGG